MSLPLAFHRAVSTDLDEACRWYDTQRAGLGDEFLAAVETAMERIATQPSLYGFVEGDIRQGRVARFPFAVYYRALSDRVRVLAVYHAARDPSGWRDRV